MTIVGSCGGALLAARATELAEARRRELRHSAGYGSDSARDTMSAEAAQRRRRLELLDRLLAALEARSSVGDLGGIIRTYLERVWGQRDLEALDELLDPAYRRHVSPQVEPLDVEGQRHRLAAMQAAFPDVAITLEQVVVEGDVAAFRSTMSGTHEGPFRDLAPTGRRFTVHLVDIVRVRDGRILEHWGGPDMLDLLTQLGATVVPITE
jgi:predicted ester cyclase